MGRRQVKCWPEPFEALRTGVKTHEFRRDDRFPPYDVGDSLIVQEWDPTRGVYTGRELAVRVTYISRGPDWGVPEGFCVMSVKPEPRPSARPAKPPTPTRTCASCGATVMVQVATDWKGVQPRPDSADMEWFCPNEPCREAMNAAIERAKAAWSWGCDETRDEAVQ